MLKWMRNGLMLVVLCLVTHAGDASGRLFIMEQGGRILIYQDGALLETPFLDISDQVSTGNEQGLLGLAFHPNYAENGRFFIDYTDTDGDTHVTAYQVSANANVADAESAVELLFIDQPFPNHNGGHLAFGPDGYLYIASGDGGGGGDPEGNGQNLESLLGKLLRIDVDSDGDAPYGIPADNPHTVNNDLAPGVWAYGLRNPWRFSFDRATGDLWIGDVGQNLYEEINFQAADSPGGENYGWNIMEGFEAYRNNREPRDGLVLPVVVYQHNEGCSVTGGYVYRGEALPELQGSYFYGDYCNGFIEVITPGADGEWLVAPLMDTDYSISSFGEDEAGELYLTDLAGVVRKLEKAS